MRTLFLLVCGALFTLANAGGTLAAEAGSYHSGIGKKRLEQLRAFSARKAKQAAALAGENTMKPGFEEYFAAAEKGDARAVTNSIAKLRGFIGGESYDQSIHAYWQPAIEISLGYAEAMEGQPQHVERAISELFKSIPDRSIYFGGTDSGRGLATAFSADHAAGKPFFTLTQNQLADRTYMDYLRAMYGAQIKIPDAEAVNQSFHDYIQDASKRHAAGKLKDGENVTITDGRISIQGQTAVMEVNARIVKLIFSLNPNREFYIEESFALDWMYPYLSPHRLVMKVNPKRLEKIADRDIRKDRDYWSQHTRRFLGASLAKKSKPADVCAFVKKVHGERDFSGFAGDRSFIESGWASRYFGKWRGSIAGVYGWRAIDAREKDPAESARMQKAAEAAFAQAFAMGPRNPETVHEYVNLLASAGRMEEAALIAATAVELSPHNEYFQKILNSLRAPEVKIRRQVSEIDSELEGAAVLGFY